MLARNYSIFFLFLIFLLGIAYGEESKDAPFIDREELVGHYIGSNDDQSVSLQLSPYVFKHFNFTDFVTIETFNEGEMGYWKIDGSLLELVDTDIDTPNQHLIIQENGTLLYGEDALVLKPVGPNFLGMMFHFNRTLKDSSKAAHYRSDGVLEIQEDFTAGSEPEYNQDALHLHNMGYMYESGTKYMGGRDEGMLGMTDQILDDENREELIDYQKAYEYYLKAAEKGYVQSMFNLAFYHEKGMYVEKSISTAVEWYRKAADLGHTYSETALGNILYWGVDNYPNNSVEGKKYWLSAASKGNSEAQYNLGSALLFDPASTDKQKNRGRKFIWHSALRDYPSAFYSLFNLLMDESNDWDEVDEDYQAVTIHFLVQASYLGNSAAIEFLKEMAESVKG